MAWRLCAGVLSGSARLADGIVDEYEGLDDSLAGAWRWACTATITGAMAWMDTVGATSTAARVDVSNDRSAAMNHRRYA